MPKNIPPNGGSDGAAPEPRKTAGDAEALISFVKDYYEPGHLSLPEVNSADKNAHIFGLAALPEGFRLECLKPYIDAWRARPERRDGTAELEDLDSLIAHVNRFKDEHSVLFGHVDRAAPSLTAVLDYHEAAGGQPRFGRHRARYAFPLSRAWAAWRDHDGKAMGQAAFAEFLEDRMVDVIDPPPNIARLDGAPAAADAGGDFGDLTPDERLALVVRKLGGQVARPQRLLELSRGLTVHAEHHVTSAVKLQSGEGEVVWREEHRDAAGQPLRVPSLFLIALPIFWNGAPYRVLARLRYRKDGGKLVWAYQLHDVDRALDHAVREACGRAQAETGLPLLYGRPEES